LEVLQLLHVFLRHREEELVFLPAFGNEFPGRNSADLEERHHRGMNGKPALIDDDGKPVEPRQPVQVDPQSVGDVNDRSDVHLALYVLNLLYPGPGLLELLEDRSEVKI